MPGANVFKKNFSLVVGVALPVLLVLMFWIATVVPKMTVEPPQHDLVFITDEYDYNAPIKGTVRFDIKDGTLRALFHEGSNQDYREVPRLYYFNVTTQSTREIALDFPRDLADGAVVAVPELDRLRFSNETLSPDGYVFNNRYRGHNDFFFGGGGYRYQAKIEKDGRAMKIPMPGGGSNYVDLRFLGWVVSGE